MRVVIQRVKRAKLSVSEQTYSQIGEGLLVLVGICEEDSTEDIEWLTKKISNLRIFDDENGVMNKSIIDTKRELMLVSQFTLMAKTAKGNRPSYIKAASPQIAIPIYENFIKSLNNCLHQEIATGVFGADMQIELINDGPVTIIIDTKNKE